MAGPGGNGVSDQVRHFCASVATAARWVRIEAGRDPVSGGTVGLDSGLHFLEAAPAERARYVLVLDALNFGSGWFPTLRLPEGETGTRAITRSLTEHARARGGTWSPAEMRRMSAKEVAETLGQDPGHELMVLYAEALRQLGGWLADRDALEAVGDAGGSAQVLAGLLAESMPFFADTGFHKRSQITAADLAHAGVADFADLDALTVFADNLLPHVLRCDGVLVYHDELARRIDSGEPLAPGSEMEIELRACAVHACEGIATRLGVPPRVLDNWLWNRGEAPPYSLRPAHLTRTVFY